MRSRILLSPKYTNLWIPLILGAIVSVPAWAQEHPIDTASSKLTVRAFKTGLFSGFADNHEIQAPITEGSIDEAAGRVKFMIVGKTGEQRSEEHTSELQSHHDLVCRLLLEK